MNIYEAEGTDAIVDLRAAAAELKGSASVTNDTTRRQIVAEIQTAALLDIALSLRVVAAEARAAMPVAFATAELVSDEPPAERDFLIVGDLVAVEGYDDPAEVVKLGVSEGAVWAEVVFASGADARVWASIVTRLVGDERDDDAMQEAAEASVAAVGEMTLDREGEILAGADDEPEDDIEIPVDDIDDDFDGDHHTAAATALDTLKANEAERKAAKKSGKKGSKK